MKTATKVVVGIGTVVGAGFLIRGLTRHYGVPLWERKTDLRGIYAENAVAAPSILDRVHKRIDIDALADHVVHLTPKAQNEIYDRARTLWENPGFTQPKAALVRQVLEQTAPACSFARDRKSLTEDDPRARVWDGAAWIVELMGASLEDEDRDRSVAGGHA